MTYQTINWKNIDSLNQVNQVIESSKEKPVLFLKYNPSSAESLEKKAELEANWATPENLIQLCLIDGQAANEVSLHISDLAGIPNEFPQVVLFADGVTMYDESHEMISVKKIKLALKIVNRTFKWMETRS